MASCGPHSVATLDTDANEQLIHFCIRKIMDRKANVLKCTLKVLENLSTFEMYLSTSTKDFPEMYLSTFQVLYKLYLSTDVLKYKVLLPGSDCH